MNNTTTLISILLVISLILIGISGIQDQKQHVSSELPGNSEVIQDDLPLIYNMSFISRYTKKLYFAGEAENWGSPIYTVMR